MNRRFGIVAICVAFVGGGVLALACGGDDSTGGGGNGDGGTMPTSTATSTSTGMSPDGSPPLTDGGAGGGDAGDAGVADAGLKYLNTGEFKAPVFIDYRVSDDDGGIGYYGVDIVDMNGDGKKDFVVGRNAGLSILYQEADGGFGAVGYPSPKFTWYPVTGAFTGPGKKDVVTALGTNVGNLQVMTPFPDGGYDIVDAGGDAGTLVSGVKWLIPLDINQDNKLDLIASEQTGATVLLNDGKGNFSVAQHIAAVDTFQGQWDITLVDLDHDGKRDLLVGGSNGLVGVCYGRGTTSAPFFDEMLGVPFADDPYAPRRFVFDGGEGIVSADFSLPGVEYQMQTKPRVNDGGLDGSVGYAGAGTVFGLGQELYGLEVADIDGDGLTDVLVAARTDGFLFVLRSSDTGNTAAGGGTLYGIAQQSAELDGGDAGTRPSMVKRIERYDVKGPGATIVVDDLDGDLRLDIIVYLENGKLAVLFGE